MPDEVFHEDFSNFLIGVNYSVLKTDNSKANSSAALSLITQSRRTIDIFTHNLDPRILDTAEIAEAMINFIKISQHSKIRILLGDPTNLVKSRHRLVELSRKFSSFISIRRTNPEYLSATYNLFIADKKAFIYRPSSYEYYGIVNYNANYDCKQHLERYNEIWERSEPAIELQQIFI